MHGTLSPLVHLYSDGSWKITLDQGSDSNSCRGKGSLSSWGEAAEVILPPAEGKAPAAHHSCRPGFASPRGLWVTERAGGEGQQLGWVLQVSSCQQCLRDTPQATLLPLGLYQQSPNTQPLAGILSGVCSEMVDAASCSGCWHCPVPSPHRKVASPASSPWCLTPWKARGLLSRLLSSSHPRLAGQITKMAKSFILWTLLLWWWPPELLEDLRWVFRKVTAVGEPEAAMLVSRVGGGLESNLMLQVLVFGEKFQGVWQSAAFL